jgi:hypothetical protein
VAAAALLLAACGSVAPPQPSAPDQATAAALSAEYRGLAAQAGGGTVFALDPAASSVRIFAFRGGVAARAGHNHVLSAPEFSGYVYLPGGDLPTAHLEQARFDLLFPLDRLAVDPPGVRGAAGAAFAPPLDDAARQGTRAHMLGPKNLDAERFPEVLVHGLGVGGAWPHLVAAVSMNLHGVSRTLLVPLEASLHDRTLAVAGALAIRQSDFGAGPYSALGGLLAVQDEVSIEFELSAHPAVFASPP